MNERRLASTGLVRRCWVDGGVHYVEYQFSAATQDDPAGTVTHVEAVDPALFAKLGRGALVRVLFDPANPSTAMIESIIRPMAQ